MREAVHVRDLVEVVWDDAVAGDDTWTGLDHLPKPERAYTAGYLVKDCPGYVVVAQTWGVKENGAEEVGNTWAIPQGMVVEVRLIRARDEDPADAE